MSNKLVYLLKGSTCNPCKMFEPVFDKVVSDYNLEIHKETDNTELMQKFGVRQVPVVVLADRLPNGRVEANHILIGRQLRKETMHEAIKNFLDDNPED
ncbi:thioredoxin [Salmonella phage Kenya-K18]|uniref:Thioredoxin n=1 Tax=Escherichia phage vB_EcoS_ESCO30 TaxID=2918879 RepID=A0AAE9HKC3_9CAUD|nr:putative thioredoxin [Escherichia phage vB_EcoS_ESCO30]WCZ57427.1 thioredoxin [Salmonella phage Kenya-K18]WCZ57575.1 thioredoxin [Salmonella phage Kenya-K20]